MADIRAEETDEEYEYHDNKQAHPKQSSSAVPKPAGASSSAATSSKGKETFGQKMKDKLTGSTHAERENDRAKRAEDEQKAYQRHLALRQAMNRAIETGQPQLIGKDAQGHDLYRKFSKDTTFSDTFIERLLTISKLSLQSSRVGDMVCDRPMDSTIRMRRALIRTRMRDS